MKITSVNVRKIEKMQILPQKYSDIFSDGINVYLENRKK